MVSISIILLKCFSEKIVAYFIKPEKHTQFDNVSETAT